ncbi:MAG: lectin like domain-containing protein [Anaerolineae bacterium]
MRTVGVRQHIAGLLLACALVLGGILPAGARAQAAAQNVPVPFVAWRFDQQTGTTRSLGYPASRTAWGLAEFSPAADLNITHVEFWTTDAATDVDVYLYDSFAGNAPGKRLAAKLDSVFEEAGFHAVALDAPVPVSGGDPLVAVIKITNASRGHPLQLDSEERGGRLRTFASPSGEDGSWYDVGAGSYGALAISLDARPAAPVVADGTQVRIFLPVVANGYAPQAPGWTAVLEEDFEGDAPSEWQLSDQNPAEGLYTLGKRSCRAYSGSQAGWLVGGGAGAELGCQSAYPRQVEAWAVYGPFSLAGTSAAELAFQIWLNSEPEYDGLFAGASTDGVSFYGYTVTGNSAGWRPYRLDLRAVPELGNLAGQAKVWVALIFVSDGVVRLQEGAYIDDIVLRKYTGTPADVPEEVAPDLGGTARRKEATFSLRR